MAVIGIILVFRRILQLTALAGTIHDFDVNADGLYIVGQFEYAGEDYQLINWDGNQFNGIAKSNLSIETIVPATTLAIGMGQSGQR